jgi:hypothetical protein
MSYTAYGMLLHSYRWRLHYRVALVTSELNNGAFMVLAHHWLQVTSSLDLACLAFLCSSYALAVPTCSLLSYAAALLTFPWGDQLTS